MKETLIAGSVLALAVALAPHLDSSPAAVAYPTAGASTAQLIQIDDDPEEMGACYQGYRFSPAHQQCNVVERQFCISSLTIGTRFVPGGSCPEGM